MITPFAATSALSVRSPSVGGQSIMMYWYRCTMSGVSLSRSAISRPIALKSSTSADESSSVAGATSRFFVFVGRMIDASLRSGSISTLAMFFSTVFRSMPSPTVRFACGSRSRQRTRCPSDANAPPRLMVHVVLPTPPFWLATAMIVPTRFLPSFPSPVTTRTCGSGARDSPRGARLSIARVLQRQRRDSDNWFGELVQLATNGGPLHVAPPPYHRRGGARRDTHGPVVGRLCEQARTAALLGPVAQRSRAADS